MIFDILFCRSVSHFILLDFGYDIRLDVIARLNSLPLINPPQLCGAHQCAIVRPACLEVLPLFF